MAWTGLKFVLANSLTVATEAKCRIAINNHGGVITSAADRQAILVVESFELVRALFALHTQSGGE